MLLASRCQLWSRARGGCGVGVLWHWHFGRVRQRRLRGLQPWRGQALAVRRSPPPNPGCKGPSASSYLRLQALGCRARAGTSAHRLEPVVEEAAPRRLCCERTAKPLRALIVASRQGRAADAVPREAAHAPPEVWPESAGRELLFGTELLLGRRFGLTVHLPRRRLGVEALVRGARLHVRFGGHPAWAHREAGMEGALLRLLHLALGAQLLLLGLRSRVPPAQQVRMRADATPLRLGIAALSLNDALGHDPALGVQLGRVRQLLRGGGGGGRPVVHAVKVELLELGAELPRVKAHQELADAPALGVRRGRGSGRCCCRVCEGELRWSRGLLANTRGADGPERSTCGRVARALLLREPVRRAGLFGDRLERTTGEGLLRRRRSR
mmetsp:Transcript_117946/g.328629  ORF Transcript_117946/g.328629 Transcript_117946/m.328629 type:complete len:383 (+) Transcript_117946:799-1947(+)